MTDPRFLDPAYYKVGAPDIGQFEWLSWRMTLHGHPISRYDDTLKRRVQNFQTQNLGLTGTAPGGNADGYVGPYTLRMAAADPAPVAFVDTKNFKLTLPTPLGGTTPQEINPIPDNWEQVPYFERREDGSIAFRAPANGAHTENSSYPRSELRELTLSGGLAKWSTAVGKHEMVIEQAITAVPSVKPHVVAGQIHDAADDVVMIRLEGTRLFVERGGDELALLTDKYVLGTKFRITIRTDHNGIYVYYNGLLVEKATIRGQFSGCYFKAGCYTQAYAGQKVKQSDGSYKTVPTDTYGEVVLYSLKVTHS